MMTKKDDDDSSRILWYYAGMGAQFFAAIAIGIFGGMKIDEWIGTSTPLLVWILPLLFIVGMIIKIVIETSKKPK